MLKALALVAGTAVLAASGASARDLNAIGITINSLSNPFFIEVAKGAVEAAKSVNPKTKLAIVSADNNLSKQFAQIDGFITSGVDLILVNAADPENIAPMIKRAQAAGITVVAVDAAAAGADALVQTNNVQAGEIACRYMAEKIGGRGGVVIQNGPQVSAVIDRVIGCKHALAEFPGVELLSSTGDGKGSREGGLAAMRDDLARFSDVKGVFAINDPQAIGSDLAAKQLGRSGIVITSMDGGPDIVAALKAQTQVQASATQDPYEMGKMAVQVGYEVMSGRTLENRTVWMTSKLVTRDNVGEYHGWTR